MSASQHSPNLNDIDLNHTHIRQQMREDAEQRHAKKVMLHTIAVALLLSGIGYSLLHSTVPEKLQALFLQTPAKAQAK